LPAAGELGVHVSYEDESQDWAVLYVHGFGSTRTGQKPEALEAACARGGWTFASFDFRGHGQSTGTLLDLRGSLLLDDLEGVRAYLASRGIPTVCPVGSSMGGWAAAWFTLRHPDTTLGCVLLAPALDFPHSRWAALTEEERRCWRETGRLRVRNQWVDAELGFGLVEDSGLYPEEKLALELNRPLLILHGMKDEVVPYTGSVSFLERAAHPNMQLRIYKDGDHRLLVYSAEIAESACAFFASLLELREARPVA
jgi:pimeloyl-ACP methyl ester carboxylesterase